MGRNESVDERVWIFGRTEERPADIFDDKNVSLIVRMNSLIAAPPHAAIERVQARATPAAGIEAALTSMTPPRFPRSWVKSMD